MPAECADEVNGHDASIRPLCEQLAQRVEAFLAEEPETELLRNVQQKTEEALGVLRVALERYR